MTSNVYEEITKVFFRTIPKDIHQIFHEDKQKKEKLIQVEFSNLSKLVPQKLIKDLSIACGSPCEPIWKNDCCTVTLPNPRVANALIRYVHQKRFFGSFLKVVVVKGENAVNQLSNLHDYGIKDSLMLIINQYNLNLIAKIQAFFLKDLDCATHKTMKCRNSNCELKLYCSDYHGLNDKRRRIPYPFKLYSPTLCKNAMSEKKCPKAENCLKCHNYLELEYHPLSYKKLICVHGDLCSSIKICPDSHIGTPDSVYQDTFENSLVIGLATSLDYLISSIRLMFKAAEKRGVQVLFITSTQHFIKFILDVAAPIAGLHKITVSEALSDVSNDTQPFGEARILIGTPASLLPIVIRQKEKFANLNLVISDDVTALLYVPNKFQKFEQLITQLSNARKCSKPIKHIAVAEEFSQGLHFKSNRVLQTKLEIRKQKSNINSEIRSSNRPGKNRDCGKRRKSCVEDDKSPKRRSIEDRVTSTKRRSLSRSSSHSKDTGSLKRHKMTDPATCFEHDRKQEAFSAGYSRQYGQNLMNSQHFKDLWRQFQNEYPSWDSGDDVQDNAVSSSSVVHHRKRKTSSWSSSSSCSDSSSDEEKVILILSDGEEEEEQRKAKEEKKYSEETQVLNEREKEIEPEHKSHLEVDEAKTNKETEKLLMNEEKIEEKEESNLSIPNNKTNRNLREIFRDLKLQKSLLYLKEAIKEFPHLENGFVALLESFSAAKTTSENVREALEDEELGFLFDLISDRFKLNEQLYAEQIRHCEFVLEFKNHN